MIDQERGKSAAVSSSTVRMKGGGRTPSPYQKKKKKTSPPSCAVPRGRKKARYSSVRKQKSPLTPLEGKKGEEVHRSAHSLACTEGRFVQRPGSR